MKICEIILEEINSDLKDSLESEFIRYEGNGIYKLSTDVIVKKMKDQGYSVDNMSLVNYLNSHPMVSSSDDEFIILKGNEKIGGDEGTVKQSADDQSKEKVQKLAKSVAKSEVNKG